MSPEKVQAVLLGLILLASGVLIWQVRVRVLFERWARAEVAAVARAARLTQLAHERMCKTVQAIDLRVPKRLAPSTHEVGWGTMLNDADTRVFGADETFPTMDLDAIAASRRQ
jgi:hypothetical protein